jgi:selenocysteine lyase/cysteine desulfurase
MKYISKNKTLFTFKQPGGKIRSLFSDIVYLDNNATTPLALEVTNVMAKCLGENFGNPSSAHLFGRKEILAILPVPTFLERKQERL